MRASGNKTTGERSELPKLKKYKLQEISPMSAQETPPGTGFPVRLNSSLTIEVIDKTTQIKKFLTPISVGRLRLLCSWGKEEWQLTGK